MMKTKNKLKMNMKCKCKRKLNTKLIDEKQYIDILVNIVVNTVFSQLIAETI